MIDISYHLHGSVDTAVKSYTVPAKGTSEAFDSHVLMVYGQDGSRVSFFFDSLEAMDKSLTEAFASVKELLKVRAAEKDFSVEV